MSHDSRVWYHLVLTTYGAWLYGDARGFRTRHHREHIEGDYKHPPPAGMYDELAKRSRESLVQPPVKLTSRLKRVVGMAIKERFEMLGGLVICVAVSGPHVHALVKLPKGKQREWAGLAKKHAWFAARDHGWQGKLWGKRSKAVTIVDRSHQLNAFHYIARHAQQGAWVWKWGDPAP